MKKLIENTGLPLRVAGVFIAFLLVCIIWVFIDVALRVATYFNTTLPFAVVGMLVTLLALWRIAPVAKRAFLAAWVSAKGLFR